MTKPLMTDNEIALLDKYLPRSHPILEFGCGSSTIYFIEALQIPRIVSIESDPRMIEKLKNNSIIEAGISEGRLDFIQPDIGAESGNGWGYPDSAKPQIAWLNYTLYLWPKIMDTSPAFTGVLVDGRFRLATSLLALLYLPQSLFFFHDFLNRPQYQPLLRYINIFDFADTLIAYSKREGITDSALLSVCSNYLFAPV